MGLLRNGFAFQSTQWLSALRLLADLPASKLRRTLFSSLLLPIVFPKNISSKAIQSLSVCLSLCGYIGTTLFLLLFFGWAKESSALNPA
jgi:hypothetical protein